MLERVADRIRVEPAPRQPCGDAARGFARLARGFARGTSSASTREIAAIKAPSQKMIEGSRWPISPNTTGITTAAIWFTVKATEAVAAMSASSPIFWK